MRAIRLLCIIILSVFATLTVRGATIQQDLNSIGTAIAPVANYVHSNVPAYNIMLLAFLTALTLPLIVWKRNRDVKVIVTGIGFVIVFFGGFFIFLLCDTAHAAEPSPNQTVIRTDIKALIADLKSKGQCRIPGHKSGDPVWCERKCFGGSINLEYDRTNPLEEHLSVMAGRQINGMERHFELTIDIATSNLIGVASGSRDRHENWLPVCYATPREPEDVKYKCTPGMLDFGAKLFEACVATKDGANDAFDTGDWDKSFEELWATLPRLEKPPH